MRILKELLFLGHSQLEHLQGCQSRESASQRTVKVLEEGVGYWLLRDSREVTACLWTEAEPSINFIFLLCPNTAIASWWYLRVYTFRYVRMIEEKERKDLVNKLFVEPRKQTIFMHHIPRTNYPCHVHMHTHII